ncbi:neutral zinc metallopeptidase [Microlunatus ginsengisoli]
MTAQQWGSGGWSNRPPAYGPTPQPGMATYAPQAFGRPPMGAGFGGAQPGLPQYGPAPQMPGPPRRNPLRTVLLGMIGLCLLAIAGLVITNLATGAGSEVSYQNDNFKVPPPDTSPPPIPQPKTEAEAEAFLTANPFYDQTTPAPVRCNSRPINVATASDKQLAAHFDGLMECLIRVWQPPVTKAGFQIVRPSVTIYGDEITTKCGTSDVNAFYCSADQQVYFSNQLPKYVTIVAEDKWAADVVMAHEFGHALQGRTGILISSAALGQLSGEKSTELLFSRRSETQADCFSGMFMRSVSVSLGIQQSDVAGILATYKAVGDDTLTGNPKVEASHGLARSRVYWGNTGLGTSDVGKCNTFSAPASQVR